MHNAASVEPPGGKVTMMRIGFAGQAADCAAATVAALMDCTGKTVRPAPMSKAR